MLEIFQKILVEKCLLQKNDRILLAVSGGVDSVVMCDLMEEAEIDFGIAHCNFQLRGRASDEDEQFVQELSVLRYGSPFFSTRFETEEYADSHKKSIQVAARELRYQWLENIRQRNNYKFIATAHHQNDVIETILYNLTKGTGIAGLHGILPKNGKVIRPLLFASKEQIVAYANSKELPFREDASNAETKYTRNKIRHLVVPTLKEINPSLEQTFYENTQRFTEIEMIYQAGIKAYKKQLVQRNKHEILIPIRKLQKVEAVRTVLYEILKEYNFNNDQVDFIIRSFNSLSGKLFYSATHQLIKGRKFLILSEKTEKDTDFTLVLHGQKTVRKTDIELSLETVDNQAFEIPKVLDIACLDAKKVVFPLFLRRWKKGDYFYPFGMGHKKKKVGRFFIDQKLSLNEKERVWILEDNKKRIIWVVGYRIDERFRITDKTKQILKIELRKIVD